MFSLSKLAGSVGLAINKNKSELYLAGGIAAGVAAVVLVARAHKKSDEILSNDLYEIHNVKESEIGDTAIVQGGVDEDGLIGWNDVVISDENTRRSIITKAYGRVAFKSTLLYGPGVLMGALSIGCLLASHGVLKERNQALVGVVAVLEKSFSSYRKRVVEEFGSEVDKRLFLGSEERTLVSVTKDEDGKKKKSESKTNHMPDEYEPTMYNRIFEQGSSRDWRMDKEWNRVFLHTVQTHLNDQLVLRGWVTLNEAYTALGFKHSREGAVVGWSENTRPANDEYDGAIDLGLDDDVNLHEGDNRFHLNFNVHGLILDHIGED